MFVDAIGINRTPLPDNLTLSQMDKNLEKWVSFHTKSLMAAAIHGTRIAEDPKRCHTHIIHIMLQPRPAIEHKNQKGKYFRVIEARSLTFDEARRLGGAWPESLDQIQIMRDEHEAAGRGSITAAAIEGKLIYFRIWNEYRSLLIQLHLSVYRWSRWAVSNAPGGPSSKDGRMSFSKMSSVG